MVDPVLFNSPVFLFYFLPFVLAAALVLRTRAQGVLPFITFVSGASLLFYAYARVEWLALILGSIVVNYAFGNALGAGVRYRRLLLTVAVGLNLALLGTFKYADFFIDNGNLLFGTSFATLGILLPIGISFYTFQQIAYLVDVYRDRGVRRRFSEYFFFVSFFPQLIAGPIVHHKQLIPQLQTVRQRPLLEDLTIGLIWFLLGLAKKVLLADTFGGYANEYFVQPQGQALDAWLGVTAYSLQIYFDFSGYSDMAIGLGRMFGLQLPINFASPYKARSIIDFWRRWHITLSEFLRDYLYIPLGGNRKGSVRRFCNLFITMLLGGLWHGAGWGFVLWGALHGVYLCLNHAVTQLHVPGWVRVCGWPVTLLAVVFAWVPFRASDLATTVAIWTQMLGYGDGTVFLAADMTLWLYLAVGCAIAGWAPNTQELIDQVYGHTGDAAVSPQPAYLRPVVAALAGVAAALGLALNNRIAEFLYFQF